MYKKGSLNFHQTLQLPRFTLFNNMYIEHIHTHTNRHTQMGHSAILGFLRTFFLCMQPTSHFKNRLNMIYSYFGL